MRARIPRKVKLAVMRDHRSFRQCKNDRRRQNQYWNWMDREGYKFEYND